MEFILSKIYCIPHSAIKIFFFNRGAVFVESSLLFYLSGLVQNDVTPPPGIGDMDIPGGICTFTVSIIKRVAAET